MSVRYSSLEVVCDEPDCFDGFEADDMTKSAAEARYHAIYAGWQSISTDGLRRDYCPKHKKKAPDLAEKKKRNLGVCPKCGRFLSSSSQCGLCDRRKT